MKLGISGLMIDQLDFFQSFDGVKVHNDDGQEVVKRALDQLVDLIMSKGTAERCKTCMLEYRLEQLAVIRAEQISNISVTRWGLGG